MTSTINTSAGVQQPLVLYLHILKTAGNTMRMILQREYKGGAYYELNYRWRNQEGIKEFKSLPLERRNKVRLIKGHLCFGVHTLLDQPCAYITFLREPIERVVSLYYFIRRRADHELYETVNSKNLSLADFIQSGLAVDADNAQTRQLSGVWNAFTEVGYGECTHNMLEQAKLNLAERFCVIGLTEEFDRSLLMLKHILNWRRVYYVRRNVTADRPPLHDIPSDAISLVQQQNKFDIELYEYAQKLFQKQVSEHSYWLDKDLPRFEKTNAHYARAYTLIKRLIPSAPLRSIARRFS